MTRQSLLNIETATIEVSKMVDLAALRLCVVQSRLRLTTKSPPRWGSREGANWGAVVRIAAASAVTLTRRATQADDGPIALVFSGHGAVAAVGVS